jgi:hypothetical protein
MVEAPVAFADPEQVAITLAEMRANAEAMLTAGGADAAAARGHPAFEGLFHWIRQEMEAGTHYPDLIEAAGRLAGAFLAMAALNAAREGAEWDVFLIGMREAMAYGMAGVEGGSQHACRMHPGQRQ